MGEFLVLVIFLVCEPHMVECLYFGKFILMIDYMDNSLYDLLSIWVNFHTGEPSIAECVIGECLFSESQ